MFEVAALAALAGFSLGYAAGRVDRTPVKALKLVSREFQPPSALAADPDALTRQQWELNLCAFAQYGDLCGFRLRTMREEYVTEPGWKVYMALLKDIGALDVRPRAPVRWRAGWGVRHLRLALKHGVIRPPYPSTPPPPVGIRRGK